jgi:hypothetical protein
MIRHPTALWLVAVTAVAACGKSGVTSTPDATSALPAPVTVPSTTPSAAIAEAKTDAEATVSVGPMRALAARDLDGEKYILRSTSRSAYAVDPSFRAGPPRFLEHAEARWRLLRGSPEK